MSDTHSLMSSGDKRLPIPNQTQFDLGICVFVCVGGGGPREVIRMSATPFNIAHTSRVVFTTNQTLVTNFFQSFEEEFKVDFSIFIWFMPVWYLAHLNVS